MTSPTNEQQRVDVREVTRGDLVQTWFDTGAMGATLLYGEVIAAGPKAIRVRWESGLTNRVLRDTSFVAPAKNVELARAALANVGAQS